METPDCSPAVRELIRRSAEAVLTAPTSWFTEIEDAAFSASDMQPVAVDPEWRAFAIRGTHTLLLHWASVNAADPGHAVPPLVDDLRNIAQVIVHRGHTEASVEAYRLGQNVAWRRWMKIAFSLSTDVADLEDMLDITSESIGTFVDATITALTAEITRERERAQRSREADRLESVSLLIDGGRPDIPSTEFLLGYRLDQTHTAVVVWTTEASPQLTKMERAVDELAEQVGARGSTRVTASPGTVWGWLGGVDIGQLHDTTKNTPDSTPWRIAVGSTGRGRDGFRTSHLDALSTQRMMARMKTEHTVATFDDVEGILLLTSSPDHADRFVTHTLGPLAGAHPELREAVRVYLREQCNASKAANSLFAHRNTLLRRIKHANNLLPRPIEDNALNIGMALEIAYWRGSVATDQHNAPG
ncbi:PucR family transcriptional regulator [Williamsia sterculiae]|uniref:DNA-binding transcriptional regulator, PucR family n=1 Tax=Williamsia sterculiae TaxID=1344003 RepID=A0A1N7EX83_9NOCA|nr:helix-turn-helix domain-containing protein [Williamsia sterculiae]SIR92686.1 DNA-binding transcriptional regulator, PucR family [Williamsia sterculiae]